MPGIQGHREPGPIGVQIQRLHPAYFALLMATGIVSIAAHLQGMQLFAKCLAWLNTAAFAVLWTFTMTRLIRFREALLRDFADFSRGPGFFTLVAGTAVLGSQWWTVLGNWTVALVLWLIAIPLWFCFMYGVFTALIVRERKPVFAEGINGGWLLAVVATQAISELAASLSPRFSGHEEEVLFFSFSMWLCGGMLYLWLISLIFYRYIFFPFHSSDLMPPSWINMGAMAISTFAGAALMERAPAERFLASMLPFLSGFTVLFWATATWWIPMLATLEFWRHVVKKVRLIYDPLYWGAVFPLGMYSASTHRLCETMDLPFLSWIPRTFFYIAVAAWFATFIGLVRRMMSILREAGADAAD